MELLDRPEYGFLKNDPHLGQNIIFLTYGGSYAYGTNMERVPLREFTGTMGELVEITRNYDKIHHRNKKKDDAHLNKHAMHLVRLYLMCLDILEKEEIVTYRESDHDLLMDIRNGRYQKADHTFNADFYDLLNDLEKRLDYAKQNTSLPEAPDLARIEAFQMEVNERVVRDET